MSDNDIMSFGLILGITNISGIEGCLGIDSDWKAKTMGVSVLFIVFFAVMFAITCFQELPANPVSEKLVRYCGLTAGVVSLIVSYFIWKRIAAQHAKGLG
ncbi:MAG: hypothetical protein WBG50_09730 [Desulfomonilaceae bacterium]